MNKSEQPVYQKIIDTFKETDSVQQTALLTGVSRNTVQRVLLTEGLWESMRSRTVTNLLSKGYTAQMIADQLYLSLKCVQNYMPYAKGMNNGIVTENAKRSKEKRDRMKIAFDMQIGNQKLQIESEHRKKAIVNKEVTQEMTTVHPYDANRESTGNESTAELSVKRYPPTVLKLKLELVDSFGNVITWTADELSVLRKYAKFQNGFVREVLVPASMSLNALNYMIQKLYGWQNGHLHSFSLLPNIFDAVTDGSSIKQWQKLCGVLFRYPDEDDGDRYCGDDYDGTVSFKTWLKNKYSKTELPFCVSDTYIENQRMIAENENVWQKMLADGCTTLEPVEFALSMGGPCDTLVERLEVGNLLCTKDTIPYITEWQQTTMEEITAKQKLIEFLQEKKTCYLSLIENLRELRSHRLTIEQLELYTHRNSFLHDVPKSQTKQIYRDGIKKIHFLESALKKKCSALEPQIVPLTNTLLYSYDYGDGWCIRITCTEEYYINDTWDHPDKNGFVSVFFDEEQWIENWEFYSSSTDRKVTDNFADILRTVTSQKSPVCTAADGLCLLDNVGGAHGFVDMIRTIHGDNATEADEMREWARGMGWTGRMLRPDRML